MMEESFRHRCVFCSNTDKQDLGGMRGLNGWNPTYLTSKDSWKFSTYESGSARRLLLLPLGLPDRSRPIASRETYTEKKILLYELNSFSCQTIW